MAAVALARSGRHELDRRLAPAMETEMRLDSKKRADYPGIVLGNRDWAQISLDAALED